MSLVNIADALNTHFEEIPIMYVMVVETMQPNVFIATLTLTL